MQAITEHHLLIAINLAFQIHYGQVDKSGDRYVYHPLRVGLSLLPDLEAAIVGLLHDSLEDTSLQHSQVEAYFGKHIADQVKLLTREPDVDYLQYVRSLASHPLARKVKRADLADNMNRDRLKRAGECGVNVEGLLAHYQPAAEFLDSL